MTHSGETKPEIKTRGRGTLSALVAGVVLVAAMIAVGMAALVASPAKAAEPAKQLFGAKALPADMKARAIGSYARGCMAGGKALPVTGDAWQVMRLERNRNWGQPVLIDYLEQLARDARDKDGWPGLLVGDLAQPRGGPMLTGHASHQIGLDADIWLRAMPDHEMSAAERSEKSGISAISMLAGDNIHADPNKFTDAEKKLIRRAASYPQVARIFLHPGLKQALCKWAGDDRAWLSKVRPWWGHYYHFHVRLKCPAGSSECENQPAPAADDGCGKELDDWIAMISRPPAPPKPGQKPKPKRELTLASLPATCSDVLAASDLIGQRLAADTGPTTAPAPTMPNVPMPAKRPDIK
ncbi:MAG: penicillin-insensitive murein endopeptidase [Rhodobiaceae bacterium]|nr:penicillin-insensitive murein endopeptidase [Rhodobiaceae bacterium]